MSQRIKIIKDTAEHKSGEIKVVDNNVAHALIEQGLAILSKEMKQGIDYKTKKVLSNRLYKRQGGR